MSMTASGFRWAEVNTREDVQLLLEALLASMIEVVEYAPPKIRDDDREMGKFIGGSVSTGASMVKRIAITDKVETSRAAYALVCDTLRDMLLAATAHYRKTEKSFKIPDRTVATLMAVIRPVPKRGSNGCDAG